MLCVTLSFWKVEFRFLCCRHHNGRPPTRVIVVATIRKIVLANSSFELVCTKGWWQKKIWLRIDKCVRVCFKFHFWHFRWDDRDDGGFIAQAPPSNWSSNWKFVGRKTLSCRVAAALVWSRSNHFAHNALCKRRNFVDLLWWIRRPIR